MAKDRYTTLQGIAGSYLSRPEVAISDVLDLRLRADCEWENPYLEEVFVAQESTTKAFYLVKTVTPSLKLFVGGVEADELVYDPALVLNGPHDLRVVYRPSTSVTWRLDAAVETNATAVAWGGTSGSLLIVGARGASGDTDPFNGDIHYVELRDGDNGTPLTRFDTRHLHAYKQSGEVT